MTCAAALASNSMLALTTARAAEMIWKIVRTPHPVDRWRRQAWEPRCRLPQHRLGGIVQELLDLVVVGLARGPVRHHEAGGGEHERKASVDVCAHPE